MIKASKRELTAIFATKRLCLLENRKQRIAIY